MLAIDPIRVSESVAVEVEQAALRRSATQLSETFFAQMLKSSGLEKALGGKEGMGQNLSFLATDAIAEKLAIGSPQFTEHLYKQLSNMGRQS